MKKEATEETGYQGDRTVRLDHRNIGGSALGWREQWGRWCYWGPDVGVVLWKVGSWLTSKELETQGRVPETPSRSGESMIKKCPVCALFHALLVHLCG